MKIKKLETIKDVGTITTWYELNNEFIGGIFNHGYIVHLCLKCDHFEIRRFATVKEAYLAMLKIVREKHGSY